MAEQKKPEKETQYNEHKEKKADNSIMIKKSTVKIAVLLVVFLIAGFIAGVSFSGTTGNTAGNSVPKNIVGQNVIKYLNDNIIQPGTTATFVSIAEENGLYKITTSYQNQNIPIYATKDGSMIFLSQPAYTNDTVPSQTAQQNAEITKSDKPVVELFVMSFCPYGVQAENIIKPVVDMFGDKIDMKIRFIVNVGGTTVDSVESLHGANEAVEDLRQVCIDKYYPEKYWGYVMDINQNCYSKARDSAALDECWKAAASKLAMNTTKIDECSKSSEGMNLLKEDERITNGYSVTGSPTLIINGAKYNGARSTDGFKQAICGAFNTKPSECGQVVDSVNIEAPAGGCGV